MQASMASAIGVARIPTQGSCRPVVSTVTASPRVLMVRRGNRMLEVGLRAIDTVRSWPVEMPPSTPPLLLETKPRGVISSPCSLPFCTIDPNPAPISTPLTALMDIIVHAISASSRPAAAARVADAVFLPVGVSGVAGPELVGDRGVVFRARVFVAHDEADRGAGGAPLVHPGENLDRVGLAPLRDVA